MFTNLTLQALRSEMYCRREAREGREGRARSTASANALSFSLAGKGEAHLLETSHVGRHGCKRASPLRDYGRRGGRRVEEGGRLKGRSEGRRGQGVRRSRARSGNLVSFSFVSLPFPPSNPNNPSPPDPSKMDPFRLLTQGASFSKKSALFKQKKQAQHDSDDDEDESNAASTSTGPAPLPAALDFFNVGSGVKDGDASGENAKGKRKREERPTEAGE